MMQNLETAKYIKTFFPSKNFIIAPSTAAVTYMASSLERYGSDYGANTYLNSF